MEEYKSGVFMSSLTDLYNNIRTLISRTFEYSVEEDSNLQMETHSLMEYENGELTFYPLTVTDFSSWSGSQPIYSDFILPYNHEIIITFKGTPNIQVGCSDSSDHWIYAQNIGYGNSKTFSYRDSSDGVVTKTPSFSLNTNSIYRITCYENLVKFYVDDVLIHSQITYDTSNIARLIRIYDDVSNVELLTVNPYNFSTRCLTENDIISNWSKYTDVSGRTIYKTPLGLDSYESVELEFKFKTISNGGCVLGMDLYDANNYNIRCAVIVSNQTTLTSYYSSSSSNRNKNGTTITLSTDSVYKLKLVNGDKAYWYKDNSLFASYSIERTTTSNLRLDIFDNIDTHLEYLKITRGI